MKINKVHVLPFILAVEKELFAIKLRAVTGIEVPAVVVTESVNETNGRRYYFIS